MNASLSPMTVPAWDDPADLGWELERKEREAVSLRAEVVAYHAFARSLGFTEAQIADGLVMYRGRA